MNLWLIFLTGLTTGGITCLAVQGGLLATIKDRAGIIVFLIFKALGYAVLGALLGALGQAVMITTSVKAIMALAAGVLMVVSALNILNVHPIFRYFVISPPKFVYKWLKVESSAAILGLMTVFVPCGTTQAMMLLAISSGSALLGALTMFMFVLGTAPAFLILGLGLSKINPKISGAIVLVLGILSLNSSLNLFGSTLTLETVGQEIVSVFTINKSPEVLGTVANGVEELTINISSSGYNPSSLAVHKGNKIKLNLVTNNSRGCANDFTIPALGIEKYVPVTGKEVVEFTAPNNPTTIAFTCGMGMYRGQIKVI